MYSELLLRPASMSDQRIYPLDARRLVASALDGQPIREAFFGRQVARPAGKDHDGHLPLTPIIFDGGMGFVRIYGIGEEGANLLLDEMGKIVRAVSEKMGCPVSADIRQGSHLRKHPDRLVTYFIAKLALAKTGKNRNDPYKARAEECQAAGNDLNKLLPMITAVIDKGVVSQAENLDSEGKDPERILATLPRDLVIRVHEGTPSISRIHKDRPGHAYIIRNLKFTMLGDLYGPWSVGQLRAHGCGLIKKLAGDMDRA